MMITADQIRAFAARTANAIQTAGGEDVEMIAFGTSGGTVHLNLAVEPLSPDRALQLGGAVVGNERVLRIPKTERATEPARGELVTIDGEQYTVLKVIKSKNPFAAEHIAILKPRSIR